MSPGHLHASVVLAGWPSSRSARARGMQVLGLELQEHVSSRIDCPCMLLCMTSSTI